MDRGAWTNCCEWCRRMTSISARLRSVVSLSLSSLSEAPAAAERGAHGLVCHGPHVSQRSIICSRECVCVGACLVASVRAAPSTNARRFSDVARQGRCHHISPPVRCHHLPSELLSTLSKRSFHSPVATAPLCLPAPIYCASSS